MRKYTPVACGMYDELESFATTGAIITIQFFIDGIITEETGKVVDLFSRDKAEFLRSANGMEIRLDDLLSVNGKSYSPNC